MPPANDLHQKIAAYHDRVVAAPHHRYRSWEHCYRFFHSRTREVLLAEKDTAALQLGFYLASWGMYRGSTFLLQHTYTVHAAVVERLAAPEFAGLWDTEVGTDADAQIVDAILAAVGAVKEAYAPFGTATDTLATKVLLGTLACLPAVDRFFIDGFKASGRQCFKVNRRFVARILEFCTTHAPALRTEQARIEAANGVRYPLMKLADMYFWQVGYDMAAREAGGDPALPE